MCHHYGISALVSQTSYGKETTGGIAKCQLFSQAIYADEMQQHYKEYYPIWKGFKEAKKIYDAQSKLMNQSVYNRVQRKSVLQLAIRAS